MNVKDAHPSNHHLHDRSEVLGNGRGPPLIWHPIQQHYSPCLCYEAKAENEGSPTLNGQQNDSKYTVVRIRLR